MDADTIARNLVIPAAKIGTTLTLMQLKSLINQTPENTMLIKVPSIANLGLETIKVDM